MKLISEQPKLSLEIKSEEGIFGPKFADDESELYYSVSGVIKDINILKNLFLLFIEVLEELRLMGVVSDKKPSVKLYKK